MLRTVFTILLALTAHFSFGQKLLLEDIFKIYNTTDSLSLKQYCAEKNFELIEVGEDAWLVHYDFRVNEEINFSRSYPKNNGSGAVYYHFSDHQDYKDFKKTIRQMGFNLHRENTSRKLNDAANFFYYRNKTDEIVLTIKRRNAKMIGFSLQISSIPNIPGRMWNVL